MNTLLLTIDAWRVSHTSFTPGCTGVETPELAALASEGTVFSEAIAHGPATPYSFPALLTSTLPLDHGGYERIRPSRTLVSEALSEAGVRCFGVHGNPWLGEKYGYGRGYDRYRDVGEFGLPLAERGRELLLRLGTDHPVYRLVQTAYRLAQGPLDRVRGDGADEVSVARTYVDAGTGDGDDWFVWVHLLTPHAPYTPPARHRDAVGVPDFDGDAARLVTRAQRAPDDVGDRERRIVEGLYAASVRHADEQAGRLLEAVDEETLVVVTADHGEALFEHGQLGHEPALHDELVHVPLLVRPPGGVDRPVVDTQVRHVDVVPTILDYADAPVPDSVRGRSLRPAIEGDPVEHRHAVSEVASQTTRPGTVDPDALQVAVRSPERKVVYADGAVAGFDLVADPRERDPIANPRGEHWTPLLDRLERRLDSIDFADTASATRDEHVQQRLRDLGYVD